MVKEQTAILSGKAEKGTLANIYEHHGNQLTLLKTVKTGRNGTFSAELDLDILIPEAETLTAKLQQTES